MLNHDSLTNNQQGDNCSSVRVETVHSLLPKAIELVWLIESDTFIFFTRTSHICTYLFPLISHKCILLFEKKLRQRHGGSSNQNAGGKKYTTDIGMCGLRAGNVMSKE